MVNKFYTEPISRPHSNWNIGLYVILGIIIIVLIYLIYSLNNNVGPFSNSNNYSISQWASSDTSKSGGLLLPAGLVPNNFHDYFNLSGYFGGTTPYEQITNPTSVP